MRSAVRRPRRDAEPRRARRARRAIHVRARARGRHARRRTPAILTGRYPYEHGVRDNTGYRARAGQPTAGHAAQGARLRDRRVRRRLPARSPIRPQRRVRRLRRPLGDTGGSGDSGERGAPRRRRRRTPRSTGLARSRGKWFGWVHVYDPHAPYQPPAELAAPLPLRPVPRRSVVDRLRARPAVRSPGVAAAADAGHRHRRSRREPGRARRADARPLRLRIDAARPAHRLGVSSGRRQQPVRARAIDTAVRHIDLAADDPRRGRRRAAVPTLPGASLLDSCGAEAATDRPSYFEAMTATLYARLGAAARRDHRPRQVHRPADRGAVRARQRSARGA